MTTENPYRSTSRRYAIAEMALAGKSKRETYASLRPLVQSQNEPFVFKYNDPLTHTRKAKTIGEQYGELMNEIGRVYKDLGRSRSADFESEEITDDSDVSEEIEDSEEEISDDACDNCGKVKELFHDEASGQSLCEDCLPEMEDETRVEAKGKKRIKDEILYFRKRIRELRAFCLRREEMSEPLDNISTRPAKEAVKLIPAGIPADALLAAVTLTWPKDARTDAGVKDFDFVALSAKIMKERGIEDWRDSEGGIPHKMFGYALVLAENRVPLFLIGPAGTGKSHLAWQLSEFLFGSGDHYGETPMSAGATRGDLLGRQTATGYVISDFVVRYSKGGVFNFEEIDAALPEVLIVLNNALARNRLFNSTNGENYSRHEDFVAIACGNTPGLGATRQYTARERLDEATLDRWKIGRVMVEFDERVEDHILGLL